MKLQKGVLSIEYHEGRKKKLALKYRLARRTDEVLRAIKEYKSDIDSLSLSWTPEPRMDSCLINFVGS